MDDLSLGVRCNLGSRVTEPPRTYCRLHASGTTPQDASDWGREMASRVRNPPMKASASLKPDILSLVFPG
jgi:hypothetical protein